MTQAVVNAGGKVLFRGLVWESADLTDHVGERVKIMRDKSNREADCIVFDLAGNHITNAGNRRRWAKIQAELKASFGRSK